MRTRTVALGLDLLDRQVVDCDGRPVGKVDDLELSETGTGTIEVTALLLGPQALGRRVGGVIGRTMDGIGARLSGHEEPVRVGLEHVREIGVKIELRLPVAELPVGRLEAWLREHFIDAIPGAEHETG